MRDFKRSELIQKLIVFPVTKSQKAHRANKEHFNGIVRRIQLVKANLQTGKGAEPILV